MLIILLFLIHLILFYFIYSLSYEILELLKNVIFWKFSYAIFFTWQLFSSSIFFFVPCLLLMFPIMTGTVLCPYFHTFHISVLKSFMLREYLFLLFRFLLSIKQSNFTKCTPSFINTLQCGSLLSLYLYIFTYTIEPRNIHSPSAVSDLSNKPIRVPVLGHQKC